MNEELILEIALIAAKIIAMRVEDPNLTDDQVKAKLQNDATALLAKIAADKNRG